MAQGTPELLTQFCPLPGAAASPTNNVPGRPLGTPPDEPVATAREALQLAVVPPLLPAQLHFQGPLPLTAEAVPAEQRLLVGAVLSACPFTAPQAPLVAVPPAAA